MKTVGNLGREPRTVYGYRNIPYAERSAYNVAVLRFQVQYTVLKSTGLVKKRWAKGCVITDLVSWLAVSSFLWLRILRNEFETFSSNPSRTRKSSAPSPNPMMLVATDLCVPKP